ncbi:MAG: hypothetical protein HY957_10800 [Nitrospirae bacterium]|nr:hypothetical protein [Nitrospirota bacterium]
MEPSFKKEPVEIRIPELEKKFKQAAKPPVKILQKQEKEEEKKTGSRKLLFAVLIFFVVIAGLIFFKKESGKQHQVENQVAGREIAKEDVVSGEDAAKPSVKTEQTPDEFFIKKVIFSPPQPLITDTIKADVSSDYQGTGHITYEYTWRINGKPVKGIKDNTLPPGEFKKRDHISVMVTPFIDGAEKDVYKSMFVVIHSSPPSLALALKETIHKLNGSITMQLVGSDPDGDKVTFSLEEPFLEGMTVDRETGEIIWKPEKKEKGIYKFRASATDSDGIKTAKTFEFRIDVGEVKK